MSWELIVIAWVLPIGIAYTIGRGRDRGGAGLLLGLLLSWLGVVVALFLPAGGVKCPACAERVKVEAKVCRHCGTPLALVEGNPWAKDKFVAAGPPPARPARPARKVAPGRDRDTV